MASRNGWVPDTRHGPDDELEALVCVFLAMESTLAVERGEAGGKKRWTSLPDQAILDLARLNSSNFRTVSHRLMSN